MYYEFDLNDDGHISRREFYSIIRNMGINPKEKDLDLVFNTIDFDQNGKLDFCELLCVAHNVMDATEFPGETQNLLKYVFSIFDKRIQAKPYYSNIKKKATKKRHPGLDTEFIETHVMENLPILNTNARELDEFFKELQEIVSKEKNYDLTQDELKMVGNNLFKAPRVWADVY